MHFRNYISFKLGLFCKLHFCRHMITSETWISYLLSYLLIAITDNAVYTRQSAKACGSCEHIVLFY